MQAEFTCKMLNLFVGKGHMNYANKASLWLHIMLNLHIDRPWLFEKLCSGFHSIRCTDQFLAGLWSDLVIQQFMMRSIKYRQEFTRGRGRMGKNACDLWVGTRHKCGEVHHAMQLVTRQHHQSNDMLKWIHHILKETILVPSFAMNYCKNVIQSWMIQDFTA